MSAKQFDASGYVLFLQYRALGSSTLSGRDQGMQRTAAAGSQKRKGSGVYT
jgi:hypothetical protein